MCGRRYTGSGFKAPVTMLLGAWALAGEGAYAGYERTFSACINQRSMRLTVGLRKQRGFSSVAIAIQRGNAFALIAGDRHAVMEARKRESLQT